MGDGDTLLDKAMMMGKQPTHMRQYRVNRVKEKVLV